MKTRSLLLALILGLGLTAFAQTNGDDVGPLVSGQPVEHEIAANESHIYQISLKAGQFVLFHLDQQTIRSALILTAPDGKQLAEMNPRGTFEQKTLWLEAAATGSYRLTVRGRALVSLVRGSYRLEATVQESASPEDRKRLAAPCS